VEVGVEKRKLECVGKNCVPESDAAGERDKLCVSKLLGVRAKSDGDAEWEKEGALVRDALTQKVPRGAEGDKDREERSRDGEALADKVPPSFKTTPPIEGDPVKVPAKAVNEEWSEEEGGADVVLVRVSERRDESVNEEVGVPLEVGEVENFPGEGELHAVTVPDFVTKDKTVPVVVTVKK